MTVKNDVPGTILGSRVRFLWDRSRSVTYDSDQTSSSFTIGGSGGTRVYTFTYTPTITGQFYYAPAVQTSIGGTYKLTDSWDWTWWVTVI